jgi:hypothetical protein
MSIEHLMCCKPVGTGGTLFVEISMCQSSKTERSFERATISAVGLSVKPHGY